MCQVDIFTVDAFTNEPFHGNPAAVCLPAAQDLTDDRMRQIASEMNLSETAFVQLINAGDSYSSSGEFKLRWFTPTHEVNLCGHATLASAAVLFRRMGNTFTRCVFHTLSGELTAEKEENSISLNFPLNPPSSISNAQVRTIVERLLELVCKDSEVEDTNFSTTTKKLLIRLKDNSEPQKVLSGLRPDFARMKQLEVVKGVIVTCRKPPALKDDVDFYSRYFAPWVGIDEDPVTGSAHTVLAPYWSNLLGKSQFNAIQCSKRVGNLKVKIEGDRCILKGNAVIVVEGKIFNPV